MTQQQPSAMDQSAQGRRGRSPLVIALALLVGVGIGWYVGAGFRSAEGAERPATVAAPHIAARSPEEAGRYLVQIGGCNDCHTPGFAMNQGQTKETDWLVGDQIGYRGPWGTSYPSNLRLYVKDLTEEGWVMMMQRRKTQPPMPWPSMNAMTEADLRAVYRYIKSLEVKGDKAPAYVMPNQEPKAPYIVFEPQPPKAAP